MGLADLIASRTESIEMPLEDATDTAEAVRARLMAECRDELAAQGLAGDALEVAVRYGLRVAGSDTILTVPGGSPQDVAAAFGEAHRTRFGVAPGDEPLVLASITVEAREIGRAHV